MTEPIIRVENLGKKYLLKHQSGGERYRALRDVLGDGLKSGFGLFGRTMDGRSGSSTEEFWALNDVSFDVKEGEVVGIIGRNGAGKSTLLKILSRITEPTVGRVTLNGRVGSLLEVGTGFHPELTGRENVYLNGSILGMTRREIARKFDEIVAFAEVERFLDTPVKRYSSGMYVRLAFAVAAHLEPEILVVDEVLAVGDAAFQKKCLGKMNDAAKGGRTVLFVSHQLGQVRSLCKHAVLLDKGTILCTGSVAEVVDNYLRTGTSGAHYVVDLGSLPRPFPCGGATLTHLRINNCKPPAHDCDFEIEFRYLSHSHVSHAAFAFGFSTLEGIRLYTVDSDRLDSRIDLRSGTTGTVTLRVAELPLQPGMYQLDVGMRSGDLSAVDYLPGCARVEVFPGPRTPASIIRNDSNGCVRGRPSTVSWTPDDGTQHPLGHQEAWE